MPEPKIKLIACRALAHVLEPMLPAATQRVILDIGLHLSPERLRDRLRQEVRAIQEPGWDIILGYGLCGRAAEGVGSQESRLILPRVDDCVGALLGSRVRHKAIMGRNPGCFFLEPKWVGSEVDIFAQCQKGLERIPENRRAQIVQMTLKHYSQLALLEHGAEGGEEATAYCRQLAETHHFDFIKYFSDLRLLARLAAGDWNQEDFVIAEPGREIPYF